MSGSWTVSKLAKYLNMFYERPCWSPRGTFLSDKQTQKQSSRF